MADQELARDLGFLEAYTIGLGTMIGAGIFVLPSIAAEAAGPASSISFLIGGFVSLLAAISLSELATGMPLAGGSYYYVNRALGNFFGSIVGWGMWAGLMFATAFYMLGFGQYLTFFWGDIPVAGSALVMAALLIWINYRGVKETGSLQNVIVIALVGVILVFLAFGVFHVDWEVLRPFNPHGWGAVGGTAATVYVTFIGFEVIATSAEEIKNPGRNLPLSMIAAVVTPTIFYFLVMIVSTGVLSIEQLGLSLVPVADVAEVFLGPWGALMMVVGAVMATVSSANASILSAARVNYAMGRDQILTEWLNDIHEKFRTPYRAILVTGGVILILIAVGVGLETLADVASFSFLITYTLVHVAVIVMRRARPEDYNPDFEMPGWMYPAVPAIGLLSCLVIMSQMRPIVLGLGSAILAIGAGWYYFYARGRGSGEHLVGEAMVRPIEEAEKAEDGVYRMVVPVANPNTRPRLLEHAVRSARLHRPAEIVAANVVEVPPQTALAQNVEFEEQRMEAQRKLLNSARELVAGEEDIGIRTRALIGRDAGTTLLNLLEEESPDQVLLGWKGKRGKADTVLGRNLDRVVAKAPCEITVLKVRTSEAREVAVLAGEGPNTPLAIQRAREYRSEDGNPLRLVRFASSEAETKLEHRFVSSLARTAGLDEGEYTVDVVTPTKDHSSVGDRLIEAVNQADLVTVGATNERGIRRALFGSLAEEIGQSVSGTVALVRSRGAKPRSLVEALRQRLRRE